MRGTDGKVTGTDGNPVTETGPLLIARRPLNCTHSSYGSWGTPGCSKKGPVYRSWPDLRHSHCGAAPTWVLEWQVARESKLFLVKKGCDFYNASVKLLKHWLGHNFSS